MRSWLRLVSGAYVVRLAAAFTGVGLAAAALTAILVNLSFNALLSGYLIDQHQEHEQAVAAALADSYQREGAGSRPRWTAWVLSCCWTAAACACWTLRVPRFAAT